MKSLIVFYSRTGTTKTAAEVIASNLNCDVEEVKDTQKRGGFIGFMKSGREVGAKKLTTIKEPQFNPAAYDLVILGTPVWRDSVSTPIRTYVAQYRDTFQQVAFFCTQGGEKTNVFNELRQLCGKKPLATLHLRRKEVEKGEYREKGKQFSSSLMTS